MECLRKFLDKMPPPQQAVFAISCGTTIGYLRKAISKKQELGTKISVAIEIESQGRVTRRMLHPNDFAAKWPELAQQSQTNYRLAVEEITNKQVTCKDLSHDIYGSPELAQQEQNSKEEA